MHGETLKDQFKYLFFNYLK